MQSPTFDQVRVGDEVPKLSITPTVRRLLVESAAGSYGRTMLVREMLEAFVDQWMGPDGRLRNLAFSMRAFRAGDSPLARYGVVTGKRLDEEGGLVSLEIWTDAPDMAGARAVTGTAIVWLPVRSRHAL